MSKNYSEMLRFQALHKLVGGVSATIDQLLTVACKDIFTVLSWGNAQGCSQLKQHGGGCMEEEFKWFNYPRASTHSGCEASCQGVPN